MKCTWLVALTLLQHFPQRPENVLENVLGIEMYDELVSLEYQPLYLSKLAQVSKVHVHVVVCPESCEFGRARQAHWLLIGLGRSSPSHRVSAACVTPLPSQCAFSASSTAVDF